MRRAGALGTLLFNCVLAAAAEPEAALPDANSYVQELSRNQARREQAINDYTYDVTEVEEKLDGQGRVKERTTRLFEVFHVKGRPVRRQVAEDGAAFDAARLAREDEQVRREVREIEERKAKGKTDGPTLSQVLARYDFRTVGREEREGRMLLVMDFAARPGKRDLDHDQVWRALAGRIWVDEQEREVVRAEFRNTGGIKFGLGLAASLSRLGGSMQFQKIEDGLWMPSRVDAQVDGRMLLFKGFRVRTASTYARYRRFQVEAEEAVAAVSRP